MKNNLIKIASIAFVAFALTSCVKKEFDSPPSTNVDPDITANRTIAQIKTLADTTIKLISDNLIISGVINSDDRSGNIYKTIIFQDSTGGILINVDISNFYALFPTGRKIFVKCQGLYISKVHNAIQLGVLDSSGTQPALGRVPQSLIDAHILRGVWGQTVTPKVVPLASLFNYNAAYENMLVRFDSVEFIASDTGRTYANALSQSSASRTIQDCQGKQLEIYSSGYATFASALTPRGNGSVTAVYQVYNSYPQLVIRDLNDVNLTGYRCGEGPLLPGFNENFNNIVDGSDIQLSGWANIAVVGNRKWIGKTFGGNSYAQNTAYGSGLPAMESWLITPGLDLSILDTLTFQSAKAFFVSNQLSVWISTNFDGTNVSAATWTQLSCTLAGSPDANYAFVNSGIVPLTSFSGTGRIGFKYVGDGTTNTTTFQIDNVNVH
jgi:hypothetical protein